MGFFYYIKHMFCFQSASGRSLIKMSKIIPGTKSADPVPGKKALACQLAGSISLLHYYEEENRDHSSNCKAHSSVHTKWQEALSDTGYDVHHE